MQPHHDILIVIAKASPKDINAAAVLRILTHFDAQADGVVVVEVEFFQRYGRDFGAVDIGAVFQHAPGFQHAVLAAFQLPPGGRVNAALVAKIAGRHPGADFDAVDRERDI